MKGLNVVSVAGEHLPTSVMEMWKVQARKQARILSRELERKAQDNEDIIWVCECEEQVVADEDGNVLVMMVGGLVQVIY